MNILNLFLQKETRELLKAISERPPWKVIRGMNRRVRKMKRAGIWAKLDNLYFFDETQDVNWIDPLNKG